MTDFAKGMLAGGAAVAIGAVMATLLALVLR
jgi:hypothetical protein